MIASLRPSFFKNPDSFRHRVSLTPIDDRPPKNDECNDDDNDEFEVVRWTSDLDRLLRRWKEQVRARQMRHRQLSNRYSILHYAIGLPFTIIQAIVATGNFFQAFNLNDSSMCSNSAQWLLLVMGIFGAISTILSAVFMFMNFQSRSEDHSTASSNYEKLYRYIDSVLSMPIHLRGDPIEVIKDIRSVYDDVATNSPVLSNDPIPGGMLYKPVVEKPPLPEGVGVTQPRSQLSREETDRQDLENLQRLTFSTIPVGCEGDDFAIPFDIEDAIHNSL